MSWIKENYEKAALGGAAAILLGVVGVSVLGGADKLSSDQKKFERDDATEVPALVDVASVLESRATKAKIAKKSEGLRNIDLFVGQPLYLKVGDITPVDLYESENVHQGIPNEFWQKYGIDPTFANAADRDFDKDGFSNREEHVAGTSPADAAEHPSPLTKLVGRDVEVLKMQMRWSDFDEKSISLKYRDNNGQNLRARVAVGASFFEEGDDTVKGRFVLGEKLEKAIEPNDRPQAAYVVTDTLPRYKGTDRETFILYKKGAAAEGYNEIQDRTVKLTLNALGQENEAFTVAINESFALPFDAAATERPYKVVSIEPSESNANQFVVIVKEALKGQEKSHQFTVSKR